MGWELRGAALSAFVGTAPRANIATARMIAAGHFTATVEALYGNFGQLAVDGLHALAVEPHPASALKALYPGILRAAIEHSHFVPFVVSGESQVMR